LTKNGEANRGENQQLVNVKKETNVVRQRTVPATQGALFLRLWRDCQGTTSVASTILVTTIVAMGAMVGLATLRDHIVQQFGDVAVGLDHLDQSYAYNIEIDGNGDGDFNDPEDCIMRGRFEDISELVDVTGDAPGCLNLTIAATDEGA
jgi:hypothetical protein